jgi:hypothetical protein
VHSLRDKAVGEEAVQEGAVAQAQEEACLATGQAVFAGQGGLNPGLEKTRVFYIKKTSPVFFFFLLFSEFFGFFYIFAQKREFIGFSSFKNPFRCIQT